ncbi:MAG TPA: sigma-70 family RNA polymerase sigma factor [Steroidobacteraceae bacterium]|nr:sigma-70 family RNA polymerase sigma factor [Steroidobacteraceae bacterium]
MSGDEECTRDDLLTRALAGERAAFAGLVRRQQRAVYSLALRMLSDRHAAEDLAQEVFLQLYRNLTAVSSESHLTFWLRKVTMHRAIDRLRREPRHEVVALGEAELPASEAAAGDPILDGRLRRLLAELPPVARAVVLLRYQEDLDPADIARTLRIPVNTVKSHLRRSLGQLRERLTTTAGALT